MSQEMIAYISRAVRPLASEDVEQIAVSARENNREINVSGVLLQIGNLYVQVLEGEAENLTALLKKIRRDARHVELQVVYKAPEQSRLFPQWQMGYFNVEKYCQAHHLDFAQLRRDTGEAFAAGHTSRRAITRLSSVYARYILSELKASTQ